MDVIYGVLGGGIVSVLSVIVLFGLPKIVEGVLIKRLDSKIQHALAESNANYEIELENFRAQNQLKLNDIQLKFQIQYQNAEQEFSQRIDLLKMKYTILPDLYKKMLSAYSYIIKEKFPFEGSKNSMFELRDFITLNEFYLDDDIYETSLKCKDLLADLLEKRIECSKKGKDCNSSESYMTIADNVESEIDLLKEKIKKILR